MLKLMWIGTLLMLTISCEKLSQNIDRNAAADRSHEIEKLDRAVTAEQVRSQQQETAVVEDVKTLQEWQTKIKESAIKNQAFNDAIEKQFAPLNNCLNKPENKGCSVLEEIKDCLKSADPRPGSMLCQAVTNLYLKTADHEQRIATVASCIQTTDAFSRTSSWNIQWKNGMDECKTLKLIVQTAVDMSVELNGRLDQMQRDYDAKFLDVNRKLDALKENYSKNINILIGQMELYDKAKAEDSDRIKKIYSDSRMLFKNMVTKNPNSLDYSVRQIEDCFFNDDAVGCSN